MAFPSYVTYLYLVCFLQGVGSETGKGRGAGEVELGKGRDSKEGMESGQGGVHGRRLATI